MFQIAEIFEIVASHSTLGKSEMDAKIHGHKWHLKVHAEGKQLNKFGRMEEFKTFRKDIQSLLDNIDHKYLNEIPEFENINPTEEMTAKLAFKALSDKINTDNIRISKLELWDYEARKVSYYE